MAHRLAQIAFRIEAVELGGFDKCIGYGSALSAGVGFRRAEQLSCPGQADELRARRRCC